LQLIATNRKTGIKKLITLIFIFRCIAFPLLFKSIEKSE